MPQCTVISLFALANELEGEWQGNPDLPLRALCSLTSATPYDISFYDNPLFLPQLKQSRAAAVILPDILRQDWNGNAVIVKNPSLAFSRAVELFNCKQDNGQDIHESAVIHQSVQLPCHIKIGPGVIIEEHVLLGEGVEIGANTSLSAGVQIAENCIISSQVTLHERVSLAERVHIDSGTVIGSRPFNDQKTAGQWLPGPDLGRVLIGKGVRIGANCCIDRGSLSDTCIDDAVIIDNLVHIAHDVRIGHHTAIAAAVVIGACTVVGSHNILGGASCIGPNIQLCDDLVITGRSTVAKNISSPGVYSSGTMVSEHKRWRRNASRFRYLDDYIKRLNKLEQAMMRENNE